MRFAALAPSALLLALPVLAKADTVYTYTGNDYTFSETNNQPTNPPGTIAAPYTLTSTLDGSFTLGGNVDNLNSAVITTPTSFSFSDGVQTINNTDGKFLGVFSTDAAGNLTSYFFSITSTVNTTDNFQVDSSGSPSSFSRFVTASGNTVVAESNVPGTITAAAVSATPEPGSLALMGTGMLGLFGGLRRRFRSVA